MPQHPLPDPTDPMRRLAALAKALPAAGFLGSTLLAFNAAQLATVAVRPFSRRVFRGFGRWGADTWWGWSVTMAEKLHGTHLVLTGDPIPPGESAVVVVNHQQMADITFLMMFARSKDRLGDMRWFVKDVLKWVPGVGWGLYLLGTFFVKRDWAADRDGIERTFASFRRDKVPLWLLMFVEGTRVTEQKLPRSREHARKQGLPPLEHLLFPRTKGFVGSLIGLREQLDAVYDVTIGYPDGVPTLWQYMQGFADRAHLHVRRYPVAGLPTDEDGLSQWLIDRFYEKDELLKRFYAEGRFPDGSIR